MTFKDTMDEARDALERGEDGRAQTLAMLAVADRLDRMCEIMSRSRGDRW